ncbi:hypothetical protein Lfu02_00060 [Longispora fulva]|nr:hypothetical protein Lfu02_00060 [Longispora fulva]
MHGRTAAGVPGWAVLAAFVITLSVLPSSIWRIAAMVFNAPLLEHPSEPPIGHGPELIADSPGYIIGLSVVSEALAFLAFGLVCRWGEVWPRWIPGLGGHRVPPLAAVIPAGLGAAVLMIFPWSLTMIATGRMVTGHKGGGLVVHGWQSVAFWAAYLPLALWGPLLALLTVHYQRRRRSRTGNA